MRNIVIISHHLGGIGGVQKFISLIATQFSKDGNNVLVIGCSVPKGFVVNKDSLQNDMYESVLMHHDDIFTTVPHKLFIDSFITKKSAKYIQKRIDSLTNPIIIVANPLSYIFLKNVKFTGNQKIIGQIHTSTDFILNKKGIFRAYKFFIKKYYKSIDKVLMLTEFDAKELSLAFKWKHIDYIANPLPYIVPKQECSELNSKKIVMLGRLDENKQIHHAIIAFANTGIKHSDWKLFIYGEGEKKADLESLIIKLEMEEHIKLCEVVTDVSSVYKNANITLLTSKKEGVPMVILESMSYGVPVISYDCSPGVRGLITKETGFLVENGNKKELTQVLLQCMENEEEIKLKGVISYESIQKFDVKKIVKKWYHLFE